MPTSAFPSHPFTPWRRMTLFSLIPALFREHLARSVEPSASVKSLVADYKKQKMPFTSFQVEGGVPRTETNLTAQHLGRQERNPDTQPMAQRSQPASIVSKSSETSEASRNARPLSPFWSPIDPAFHSNELLLTGLGLNEFVRGFAGRPRGANSASSEALSLRERFNLSDRTAAAGLQ